MGITKLYKNDKILQIDCSERELIIVNDSE